ncbi:MAG: hypothetical protein Q9227_004584 [Pyrenula ochraceoflavens]
MPPQNPHRAVVRSAAPSPSGVPHNPYVPDPPIVQPGTVPAKMESGGNCFSEDKTGPICTVNGNLFDDGTMYFAVRDATCKTTIGNTIKGSSDPLATFNLKWTSKPVKITKTPTPQNNKIDTTQGFSFTVGAGAGTSTPIDVQWDKSIDYMAGKTMEFGGMEVLLRNVPCSYTPDGKPKVDGKCYIVEYNCEDGVSPSQALPRPLVASSTSGIIRPTTNPRRIARA